MYSHGRAVDQLPIVSKPHKSKFRRQRSMNVSANEAAFGERYSQIPDKNLIYFLSLDLVKVKINLMATRRNKLFVFLPSHSND
jgi:hypothetical protein